MKLLFSLSAVSAIALAAPASAAVILFDGFESPTSTGITYGGTDAAGAVFVGDTGLQSNNSPFNYVNTPEGTQSAHLQNLGSFSYQLNSLVAGTSYALSYFSAQRPNYGISSYTVSFNGVQIGTFSPTSTSWTSQNLSFIANGRSGSLVFSGNDVGGDHNVGFDAVSVTGAVPEPATWAMMIAGFGMIGVGVRSRRKMSARVAHA